jgi:PilZ domain
MSAIPDSMIQQQGVHTETHFHTFSVQTNRQPDQEFYSNAKVATDRRRDVRYATCDAVEVTVLDAAGFQIRGVLRDVSKNGLRVELGLPVDPGARLRIVLRDRAIIFAVACYCRTAARSFHVGAAINAVYHPKGGSEPVGTDLLLPSGIWQDEAGSSAVAGASDPYRCVARAILDDHVSARASGSQRWQLRMPPLADPVV